MFTSQLLGGKTGRIASTTFRWRNRFIHGTEMSWNFLKLAKNQVEVPADVLRVHFENKRTTECCGQRSSHACTRSSVREATLCRSALVLFLRPQLLPKRARPHWSCQRLRRCPASAPHPAHKCAPPRAWTSAVTPHLRHQQNRSNLTHVPPHAPPHSPPPAAEANPHPNQPPNHYPHPHPNPSPNPNNPRPKLRFASPAV